MALLSIQFSLHHGQSLHKIVMSGAGLFGAEDIRDLLSKISKLEEVLTIHSSYIELSSKGS